jgi:hypothetical protein
LSTPHKPSYPPLTPSYPHTLPPIYLGSTAEGTVAERSEDDAGEFFDYPFFENGDQDEAGWEESEEMDCGDRERGEVRQVVVVCSSGLDKKTIHAVKAACEALPHCTYIGALGSSHTHLLMHPNHTMRPPSEEEKLLQARQHSIPILNYEWILHAAGNSHWRNDCF